MFVSRETNNGIIEKPAGVSRETPALLFTNSVVSF